MGKLDKEERNMSEKMIRDGAESKLLQGRGKKEEERAYGGEVGVG